MRIKKIFKNIVLINQDHYQVKLRLLLALLSIHNFTNYCPGEMPLNPSLTSSGISGLLSISPFASSIASSNS